MFVGVACEGFVKELLLVYKKERLFGGDIGLFFFSLYFDIEVY